MFGLGSSITIEFMVNINEDSEAAQTSVTHRMKRLLLQRKQEQLPVTIYFRSGCLKGLVGEVDETFVELRDSQSRGLVRLSAIDAILSE